MISNTMNNNQLDSYSMLICSKYFKKSQDYINLICVNSKFKETTEKLRFNPISIKSLKLFPKIQTQYLYNENDKRLKKIKRFDIFYEVTYDQYVKSKQKNMKFHHITYTRPNRKKYGCSIPNCVNMIENKCFTQENIQTLTIPSYITSIGCYCFSYCSFLSNIELSKNLMLINDNCFNGCFKLTSIIIPDSVKSIGIKCFQYCNSLQTITLPPSLVKLDDSMFEFCSSLTNILLPKTLTSIGKNCFLKCLKLRDVEIPNSVKFLGINCFHKCLSLTDLKFESDISQFKFKVSYSDSLFYKKFGIDCTTINLTNHDVISLKLNDLIFTHDHNFIIPNGIKEISRYSFHNLRYIKSVTIPTTVTNLNSSCFLLCTLLTTLELPISVKILGVNCFSECSKLEKISIPSSIKTIPQSCFSHCFLLTKVKLPTTITSIKSQAFSYCEKLPSIIIPSSVVTIEGFAFSHCSSLKSVILPTPLPTLRKQSFVGCDLLMKDEIFPTSY